MSTFFTVTDLIIELDSELKQRMICLIFAFITDFVDIAVAMTELFSLIKSFYFSFDKFNLFLYFAEVIL